ncbi:4730_t:CDS:10 [Ambispora gerdemannii]|uniref:4730_t:CDS:1 n=1 Tax=Ambispora gerdemannii TaxID=144530 RepID=A0A9N8YMR1_9GLOM|nr:4730_t:CDS:10 [Ambispora gerdemannii]
MFYSKDILTRKAGGFGIIWLAATLGSRSNLRKLSKREVNSKFDYSDGFVNTYSDYVVSPPEPLALRLTSNLMIGITRVYFQQYTFYYTDVNNVWVRLRKELTAIENELINMPDPEAKYEAITIEDDPEFLIEISVPALRDIGLVPDLNNKIEFSEKSVGKDEFSNFVPILESFTGSGGSLSDLGDDELLKDDSGIRLHFEADGTLREIIPNQPNIPEFDNNDQFGAQIYEEMIREVREDHYEGEEAVERKRRRLNNQIGLENEDLLRLEDINAEMDIDTEQLSNQEILAMRDNCTRDLIKAQESARRKEISQVFKEKVKEALYTPCLQFKALELQSFWNKHCAPLMRGNRITINRELMDLADSSRNVGAITGFDEIEMDDESVVPIDDEMLEEAMRHESMLDDEPERRRAADNSQQNSGLLQFDRLNSRASSIDGVPDTGTSFVNSSLCHVSRSRFDFTQKDQFDRASSADTRANHDVSLDLSGQLGSNRNRQSSVRLDRASVSSSDGGDFIGDDFGLLPEFNIFNNDMIDDDDERFSNGINTQQDRRNESSTIVEKESYNFMEFVKSSMDQVGVSRVTFQEIMNSRRAKKSEVAKSFYHLLVLATKSKVHVSQTLPYGDIIMEFT